MSARDPLDERSAAEAAFFDWLSRRDAPDRPGFEAFCATRPELADELRLLHARWQTIEPLMRSGVSEGEFASSLRDILGSVTLDGGDPPDDAPSIQPTLQIDVARAACGADPMQILEQLTRPGERGRQRYRLVGEIARGGMGEVHRVWDEELRRHLAMKVMRARDGDEELDASGEGPTARGGPERDEDGTASTSAIAAAPAALARFLEEAFVTAQLDHPGIVAVHDLALDADGRPYFTMKLVKGRDLRRIFELVHAGREGWTLNRAVGVVLRVCEAVAYAHSKGVLHRDIKPSNVMVGRFGETYLMDWGLARILGEPGERPASSAAVAEPEPRETPTNAGAADNRPADSWLFTADQGIMGTPAYMSPEQARGEIEQVDERSDIYSLGALLYHLIAGRVPYFEPDELPLPFTVLMRARRGPPRPLAELAPDAPPTLVAICERAMERRIEDRYAGAGEMAAALEDYLEDISDAREEARRQARRAELIAGFLVDMLASGEPRRARGRDVTVRDVLDEAARRIRTAFPDQPLDEAALRTTIGNLYKQLGLLAEAEPHLARSLQLQRELLGAEHPRALAAAADLAHLHRSQGRLDEAEHLLREILPVQRAAVGDDHPDTLRTASLLAGLLKLSQTRLDEAEALYRDVVERRGRVLGDHHADTLAATNMLALLLQDKGQIDEALALQRRALDAALRHHGEAYPESLLAMNDLAGMLLQGGRLEEAEDLYRRTLEVERRVFGEQHPDTLAATNNLGMLLLRLGRADEAEALLRRALEGELTTVGPDHPNTLTFRQNLALALVELGRLGEAEALLRATVERAEATLPPDHRLTARYRFNLGRCLAALGRHDDARALLLAARRSLAETLGDAHDWTREADDALRRLDAPAP